MNRIVSFSAAIAAAVSVFLLSGCGSVYKCRLNGFGENTKETTYFIFKADSLSAYDLEFREYSGYLKERLAQAGYTEVSPENAALCITFEYYAGEERPDGTVSETSSRSYALGTTASRSSAFASGLGTSFSTGSAVYSSGSAVGYGYGKSSSALFSGTTSTTYSKVTYDTPIGCRIIAWDAHTGEQIWRMDVEDHIGKNEAGSLRTRMPWMLFAARPFFGMNAVADVEYDIALGEKEGLRETPYIPSVEIESWKDSYVDIQRIRSYSPVIKTASSDGNTEQSMMPVFKNGNVPEGDLQKANDMVSAFSKEIEIDINNGNFVAAKEKLDVLKQWYDGYKTKSLNIARNISRLSDRLVASN